MIPASYHRVLFALWWMPDSVENHPEFFRQTFSGVEKKRRKKQLLRWSRLGRLPSPGGNRCFVLVVYPSGTWIPQWVWQSFTTCHLSVKGLLSEKMGIFFSGGGRWCASSLEVSGKAPSECTRGVFVASTSPTGITASGGLLALLPKKS